MCGIIAAISQNPVVKQALNQLQRLEYRGYDSAGLATIHQRKIHVEKATGDTSSLVIPEAWSTATIAIAHTRWATHGVPSECNAHPHLYNDQYAIVHNGIIENHETIKSTYGFTCKSETDSEVIVQLYNYFIQEGDEPLEAWQKSINRLEGSWATVLLDCNLPNQLFIACHKSPMVLGKNDEGVFISSDLYGLEKKVDEILYLNNHSVGAIDVHSNLVNIEPKWEKKPASLIQETSIQTSTVMMHEIMEQPDVLEACHALTLPNIPKPDQLVITACGSSYHVGLIAAQWFEAHAGIPCRVFLASELRYQRIAWGKNTGFLMISQSGETADTLECVRHWKDEASLTIALCNVAQSALMRCCDYKIHIPAGIETAVAATKSVTASLMVLSKLADQWKAHPQPLINIEQLAHQNQIVLAMDSVSSFVANRLANQRHIYLLGRGIHHCVMLEAALKVKEISYIHTEAFASGEMKHGPLALIDDNALVVIVAGKNYHLQKSIANAEEVLARGAHVIIITDAPITQKPNMTVVNLPFEFSDASCISLSIFFQIISLKLSLQLKLNPDRPRNLAKCVTVE